MSASENLQLVRDMYAALNAQDLDAHDAYWHEDMIWHGPPGFGDIHGLAAQMKEAGADFIRDPSPSGMGGRTTAYIRGPEDVRIELSERAGETYGGG